MPTKIKLAVAGILFAYSLAVLYSHFLAGNFGFSDVTLSNEFLGNTILGRGFFYISDFGYSHFRVHFTPTLLLLAPFYLAFDSQFLLLFLGTLSFYISFVLFLFVFEEMKTIGDGSTASPQKKYPGWLPPLAFLILMALNLYTKTVLLSANAWFLYAPFFALTVWGLLRGKSIWLLLIPTLLALGVRQDTGFYFSFQIASLWFFPGSPFPGRASFRKKVMLLSALGIVYTVVCALWILPALDGLSHVDRGWRLYGQNWVEIFTTILTSPLRILNDCWHSGFTSINCRLLWLALANPFSWCLNNAPGVLLYISEDISKRYLWYYTASFLLPGLWMATWIGFLNLARFLDRDGHRYRQLVIPCLLVASILANLATTGEPTRSSDFKFVPVGRAHETAAAREAIRKALHLCPRLDRIAADSQTVVYLPNSKTRFLLHHYREADLVLFKENLDHLPVNFFSSAEARGRISADRDFRRCPSLEGPEGRLYVFVRHASACEFP